MNIRIAKTAVLRRVLAVSAVALLSSSAVLAQTAAGENAPPSAGAHAARPGPKGEPGHPGPQRLAERMQKREAALKTKLEITSQQEAAWSTWTAAVRPQQRSLERPDFKAEHEAFAQLTTPQRIDRMQALADQRRIEQVRRGDATKAFYATLTPAQQKVFDAETLRGPGPEEGPRPEPREPHDGQKPSRAK